MSNLRIFKYPFQVSDFIQVEMPKNAHILTVQAQGETACMWAIVDLGESEVEVREFRCYGTGHPIDIEVSSARYIGTFQLLGGRFIGHLFEEKR